MRFKKRKMLLTVLFVALGSGCGSVTIYDREVCGDLGAAGAHCAHTLVDETRDIPKPAWDSERVGMLCMNSQAYTDAETAIDQFCTMYNVCDYQTREAIREGFIRIQRVVLRAQIARVGK